MVKALLPVWDGVTGYLKRNKVKTVLVVLAMVLAYGFYVSSYTLNVDDVFTSFWNGGRLIAAGRFTGYLMQLATGFMTYSPFFTMFLALCVFFFAGLVTAVVLNLYAGSRLSDNAVFVFWIMFVTYPLISEQMVYPIILLLALGYLMTALSVWLVDRFFERKSVPSIVLALVLMVLYIDFYEAFATVYLTLMMATVLIRFFYSADENDRKIVKIFFRMVKLTAALAIAVVLRFVIAKAVLFAYYGTTQAGYGGNSSIYWGEIGFFDCAIWLIRTVFLRYCWSAVDYLPIFVFVLCVIAGGVLALILTVKKRSAVPVLAFLFMLAGALSLNVLLGLATNYTMAQALAMFVAVVVTALYLAAEKKKAVRIILTVCIALLVLNQAKSLNEWSVANYERYEYEMSVVDDIGQELTEHYDVEHKPVVFIGADDAPRLPEALIEKHESGQPAVKALQKLWLRISDAVIPARYYKSIGDFYGKDIENAQGLFDYVKHVRNCTSICTSYLSWAGSGDGESWFDAYEDCGIADQLYQLFDERGYPLIRCTKDDYSAYRDRYQELPAYPKNGFITEYDDVIVVNFGK